MSSERCERTSEILSCAYLCLKLNIMSAPVVTFYPATQGPNKLASGKTEPFNYDFSNL